MAKRKRSQMNLDVRRYLNTQSTTTRMTVSEISSHAGYPSKGAAIHSILTQIKGEDALEPLTK
jgi:hypothetical protein